MIAPVRGGLDRHRYILLLIPARSLLRTMIDMSA
jgi:hypothetical protein